MIGFRLKECLDPIRSWKGKISSQVQQNLLGLISATATKLHYYSWKEIQYYYRAEYF